MWVHLTRIVVDKALEKGKSPLKDRWTVAVDGVMEIQQRFGTTCFFAMFAFARWERRRFTKAPYPSPIPLRQFDIDARAWDLATPIGTDVDVKESHNCIYNVFAALGTITNSQNDAANASKLDDTRAPNMAPYVASFIVYMAHIVALATAKQAKRPVDAGNPVVFSFDIYAALLWCCGKIKERTMMENKTFNVIDILTLLSVEWRQDKLYEKDEAHENLWSAFVNKYNSANPEIISGGGDISKTLRMPGINNNSPFFSIAATLDVPKQAQRIEFLFSELFSYSVGVKGDYIDGPKWETDRCSFTAPMSLAVFPLTPGAYNIAALATATALKAWDTPDDGTIDEFNLMAQADLDLFMGALPSPTVCPEGQYMSKKTGTCLPIPVCPQTGDDPKKTVFDEDTEMCVEPAPTVCPKGQYMSKKTGTCLPIPVCPQTGDDPKKTVFDEDTEMCVEPSSGGGGGGGGGSGSGILLLLLLLIGIAFIGSR